MRMEEAVRSHSTTEEGTRFLNASGKTFAQFDAGRAFTAEYEILRADLSELFLEATKNLDSNKYMYGDSIRSLEQKDSNVKVTVTGGSTDEFDVVVAADGSTSKTRPLILDEQTRKDSYKPLGWYIAFFSIPSRPSDPKVWQWYNTLKGLSIMIRPHRNNTTMGAYLGITLPAHGQYDPAIEDAMAKGNEESKRVLRKYFENAGWEAKRVLEGMDQAEDFYMTRAAQVQHSKWTNVRALVIGDAAFATFGVGTSLAIGSAYVLAGELSKIQSSSDVPRALEQYEEVFRPMHATLDGRLPGFPQIAFPQTAWGLRLRDFLLWFVSKTKMHKMAHWEQRTSWKLPNYNWVDI